MWLYSTQCGNSHWRAWFLDATSNTRAQAAALLLCWLVSVSRNTMRRSAAFFICGYRQDCCSLDCLHCYRHHHHHHHHFYCCCIETSASSQSNQSASCSPQSRTPTCFDPVSNSVERRAERWNLIRECVTYWYSVRGWTINPYPVILVSLRYLSHLFSTPSPPGSTFALFWPHIVSSILLLLLSIFPLSFCSLLTLSRSCSISVEMVIAWF